MYGGFDMKLKVGIVSLGCDKNRIDSEAMLGILKDDYEIVSDENKADIIIINTCGFIDSAKQESIETILEMAKNKENGTCKSLIVTGCMAQRYKNELIKEMPEIDAVVGTGSYKDICDVIEKTVSKKVPFSLMNEINYKLSYEKRILTTPSHYAYIKIAEGCNNNCSYCIIPKLRGRFRSKEIEDIIKESKELVSQGVKEIILVAQDTTMYGIDIYGKKMLSHLLKEIEKIEGLRWIRVMYSYPEEITDEMIETIGNSKKICHYFDIPLQHISNKILKSMNRKTSKEKTIEIIKKIRSKISDAVIRTSIIVGYPGETDEDFKELESFIKEQELERVGIFTYSREEGTTACEMINQIDENIKEQRKDLLMRLQSKISYNNNKKLVGNFIDVIIDGVRGESEYYGRSFGDAPEIDQQVFINKKNTLLNKGDIVRVKITKAFTYDLIGDVEYESGE